jgi:hypothetical protein
MEEEDTHKDIRLGQGLRRGGLSQRVLGKNVEVPDGF